MKVHGRSKTNQIVGAVIPCFKVGPDLRQTILSLPKIFDKIYVVSDACPIDSLDSIRDLFLTEPTLFSPIYRTVNGGVGAAVKEGYRRAIEDKCDIIVKIDGDGQMNNAPIIEAVEFIAGTPAGYVKGNRLHSWQSAKKMPINRLIGNFLLQFLAKASSGYWFLGDPTNGFTIITREALRKIDLEEIDNRFFFETDMLLHLRLANVIASEINMNAFYGTERSNLSVLSSIPEFLIKNLRNFFVRIKYQYFVMQITLYSLLFLSGTISFLAGIVFGGIKWTHSIASGVSATAGEVGITLVLIIIGINSLLVFVKADYAESMKLKGVGLDK